MQTYKKFFIGVDFSKKNFDAVIVDDQENNLGHEKFDNDLKGFKSFEKWLKAFVGSKPSSQCVVCGEYTGWFSIDLADYLFGKSYSVWLEMALQIRYCSGCQRGKSDKADALAIALYAKRYYKEGKSKLYSPASPVILQAKALLVEYNGVMSDRVAEENRLGSMALDKSRTSVKRARERIDRAKKEEKIIKKELEKLLSTSEETKENYLLLVSIVGVGLLSAACIIVATSNFRYYGNARVLACYVGVVPFRKQSGSSVHTPPHVSKFSNKAVRAILRRAIVSAIRCNPVIREYAAGLRARGKKDGVVCNNCINKLLHIMVKLVETKKAFDPNYQNAHAKRA